MTIPVHVHARDAAQQAAARYLIIPNSRFRTVWDILLVWLVVYNAFSLPFVVCFKVTQPTPLVVLDQCIDIIFYCDLLLNFITSYEVKGHLVLDSKAVAFHYLKGWFLFDLLSTFPFEVFSGGDVGEAHTLQVTLLRGLKCFRLLRLARLFKFLEKIEFVNHFLKLLRLLFGFSVIAHWFACLWYLIGDIGLYGEGDGTPVGWLVSYNNSGWDAHTKSHVSRYITSLYWTITTLLTVGYGDISAHTNLEKLFAILTMVFGALISATIFGNVTMLIEALGRSETAYREKMESVKYYMIDLGLPPDIQHRIRDFYTLLWNRNKTFLGSENVLSELPPSFHEEIASFLHQDLFDKCMLFTDADVTFLRNLASRLKFCVSLPNDDIVKEGEVGDKVFFIRKGSVQVHNEKSGKLTVMKEGNYFGEIPILLNEFMDELQGGGNGINGSPNFTSTPQQQPLASPSLSAVKLNTNERSSSLATSGVKLVSQGVRSASVTALVNCDLYSLSDDDFQGVLKNYQPYYRLFLLIALIRWKQRDYHDDEDILQKVFIIQVKKKELRLKYHLKRRGADRVTDDVGINSIMKKQGKKDASTQPIDTNPNEVVFFETTKELIRRAALIGVTQEEATALKSKHANTMRDSISKLTLTPQSQQPTATDTLASKPVPTANYTSPTIARLPTPTASSSSSFNFNSSSSSSVTIHLTDSAPSHPSRLLSRNSFNTLPVTEEEEEETPGDNHTQRTILSAITQQSSNNNQNQPSHMQSSRFQYVSSSSESEGELIHIDPSDAEPPIPAPYPFAPDDRFSFSTSSMLPVYDGEGIVLMDEYDQPPTPVEYPFQTLQTNQATSNNK